MTPGLTEFDPRHIPYQYQVVNDVRRNFDYKIGSHEILLSGSLGSAKSILMSHLAVTHCIMYKGARFAFCRRALPDIKKTIFQKTIEHLTDNRLPRDLWSANETKAEIYFSNGSEIVANYWADKRYKRARSIDLSGAAFEELTENDDEDKEGFMETKARVGRITNIPEQFVICATNPDSPAHWVHKYFIEAELPTRHVYYSVTTDNPFLPEWYIKQQLQDLDPKMAQRLVYGKWVEISDEVIYYNYDRQRNYVNASYKVNPHLPIHFSFDFNIADGKPLSVVFYQIDRDVFHFFNEVVVESISTGKALLEAANRGFFDLASEYRCHGDAAGKHRDTRSNQSDYDIIDSFMRNYRRKDGLPIRYVREVPSANPPIRDRHNLVNAYCLNSEGVVRLYVYKDAKTMDEGLRLTKLKKGSQYIEDDSKHFQHITTAAGYGIYQHKLNKGTQEPTSYKR